MASVKLLFTVTSGDGAPSTWYRTACGSFYNDGTYIFTDYGTPESIRNVGLWRIDEDGLYISWDRGRWIKCGEWFSEIVTRKYLDKVAEKYLL